MIFCLLLVKPRGNSPDSKERRSLDKGKNQHPKKSPYQKLIPQKAHAELFNCIHINWFDDTDAKLWVKC